MRADITVHASLHDVMPQTLDRVEAFASRLEAAGLAPALLLVVPGCDWTPAQLDRLRALALRGHQLAGHGWHHRIARWGGLAHRLHGAILSRRAAEHLALEPQAIPALIRRCRNWFDHHSLPAPDTYVPPAWAMGAIRRRHLRGLGFRYYESLGGIYDAERDTMLRLPLVGFEADTPVRCLMLRGSNGVNAWLGRLRGELRLAIHPQDAQLLLADDLARWLAPTAAPPRPG